MKYAKNTPNFAVSNSSETLKAHIHFVLNSICERVRIQFTVKVCLREFLLFNQPTISTYVWRRHLPKYIYNNMLALCRIRHLSLPLIRRKQHSKKMKYHQDFGFALFYKHFSQGFSFQTTITCYLHHAVSCAVFFL